MRVFTGFAAIVTLLVPGNSPLHAGEPQRLWARERDEDVQIETDMLRVNVRKKGYVSGTARGRFLDKKTGARDLGFGLHIMDFLMAPGWADDDYSRDTKVHGNLPKHYVEGPQVCTQAKELKPEIIEGKDFVAMRMSFTFTNNNVRGSRLFRIQVRP